MDGYGVETLWQAHNLRLMLWALCRRCGNVRGIKPWDIMKRSRSSDSSLWEASRRLKCRSCGQHQSVLIPGIADAGAHPQIYR